MNEDGYASSIKDKILTIHVKPGWKEGTKIIFPKEGDQVKFKEHQTRQHYSDLWKNGKITRNIAGNIQLCKAPNTMWAAAFPPTPCSNRSISVHSYDLYKKNK